jgi:flagellar biosynthesis protein FlhG
MIRDFHGIDIVPGSSGVQKMAELKSHEIEDLITELSGLEGYDFIFFDTSAGISQNVVSFCMASSEIILVVTPEPTSLTDAYSLLKILSLNGFSDSVMVAVNQCKNVLIADMVYTKIKKAVQKFLPIKISPIGTIVQDSHVVEAVKAQKPFISLYPNSNAAKCVKNMARYLINSDVKEIDDRGIGSFWKRCLGFFNSDLQLRPLKVINGKTDSKGSEPAGLLMQSQRAVVEDAIDRKAMEESFSRKEHGLSESAESDQGSKDIPSLLQSLVNGVFAISKELKAIRMAIESEEKNYTKKKVSG